MKLRNLSVLFLIILVTVLQCTALNFIQIFKTKPDILLILVFFFSLYYGRIYGLIVGALCGFFSEVTSGIPSGLAVFTYACGGLILGHLGRWVYSAPVHKDGIYSRRIFGQICTCFIFVFVIYFFLFFLFQVSNIKLSLFNTLTSIILPASFYTACISPFIFRFLKTILNIR